MAAQRSRDKGRRRLKGTTSIDSSTDEASPAPDKLFADPPLPPLPIRRWPWRRWSTSQRLLVIAKLSATFLGSIAALIGALVLIAGLGPQGYRTVRWRQVEYSKLQDMHAGSNRDFIVKQLGPPAYVKQVSETPKLSQEIYLGRDYIVMTVSNSAGEAVLYSVLSCDPRFAPTFTSPSADTILQLQARPLSQSETGIPDQYYSASPDATAEDWNEDRGLINLPPSTGSSPDLLIEEGGGSGSAATRFRQYFVGINGACTDTTRFGDGPDLKYVGEQAEAPEGLLAMRRRLGANFYAEVYDLQIAPDNFGDYHPLDSKGLPMTNVSIQVTPFRFDLPTNRYNPHGTREFN